MTQTIDTSDGGSAQLARPVGLSHVRITVSDIQRSKAFYERLLGTSPMVDMSDQRDDPAVAEDPARFFGGCAFQVGSQIFGLRPSSDGGANFSPARVGLDHVSFLVESLDDLHAAADALGQAGVEHGDVRELSDLGVAILSVQDPDDINIELTAPLS